MLRPALLTVKVDCKSRNLTVKVEMPENVKHEKKERQVHHNYRISATAFHTSKLFDNIY